MEAHRWWPDDIVMEILTYLPANSLMRFKCVCKAWNTLTQDPFFVLSHYARSRNRPSATRILFQFKTNPNHQYRDEIEDIIYQLEFPSSKSSEVKDMVVKITDGEYGQYRDGEKHQFSLQLDYFCHAAEMAICTNNCNGLVCLYSYKDHQLYLYNITTREIKALPRRIFWKQFKYPTYPKMFLGFDEVTENYKLLAIHRPTRRGKPRRAEILTLGVTNSSWRKSRNRFKYNSSLLTKECVFRDGLLHWTGWSNCSPYFNFTREKFGFFSRPKEPTYVRSWFSILTPLWALTPLYGQLSVCYSYVNHTSPVLTLYNLADKACIPVDKAETIEVGAALFGAADQTKGSHVLATATAISLFTSSSICCFRFVESNKIGTHFMSVSCFVENIIPLTLICPPI